MLTGERDVRLFNLRIQTQEHAFLKSIERRQEELERRTIDANYIRWIRCVRVGCCDPESTVSSAWDTQSVGRKELGPSKSKNTGETI